LLIDRFYDLEGASGKGLLKIGKKGFNALLDMARKEQAIEDKKELARGALGKATTIEFIDEWIKILNDKNEYDRIRFSALYNIVELRDKSRIAYNCIEQLKTNYNNLDHETKISFPDLLTNIRDIPFLLSILSTESNSYIIETCLRNLSSIGPNLDDPSVIIAAIEKIIYNHGNRNVVISAKNALICFGEKESLLRLEKYLTENGGDKISIQRIQKRIKSGRKGPDYYDKYTEEEYNFHRGGGKK